MADTMGSVLFNASNVMVRHPRLMCFCALQLLTTMNLVGFALADPRPHRQTCLLLSFVSLPTASSTKGASSWRLQVSGHRALAASAGCQR
ncbi:MAG: hypothetical protein ABGX16_08450, partial [Pirellulales bacterium]